MVGVDGSTYHCVLYGTLSSSSPARTPTPTTTSAPPPSSSSNDNDSLRDQRRRLLPLPGARLRPLAVALRRLLDAGGYRTRAKTTNNERREGEKEEGRDRTCALHHLFPDSRMMKRGGWHVAVVREGGGGRDDDDRASSTTNPTAVRRRRRPASSFGTMGRIRRSRLRRTNPPSLSLHSTPSISSSAAADDDEEDVDDWRRRVGARTCAADATFASLATTPAVFVDVDNIHRRRLSIIKQQQRHKPKQQQQLAGAKRVRGMLSLLVVTRQSSYLGGWEIGADDPQTMTTTSEGNVDSVILVSSRGIVNGADSSWSGRRLGEGRGDTSSSAAVVGARSHPTCGDIIPRCTAPIAVATGRWRRGDC